MELFFSGEPFGGLKSILKHVYALEKPCVLGCKRVVPGGETEVVPNLFSSSPKHGHRAMSRPRNPASLELVVVMQYGNRSRLQHKKNDCGHYC